MLKRKKLISKSCALFLLFAFFVNSVPRVFLHELFSEHQHEHFHNSKTGEKQINKTQHCDCEKYFTENVFYANTGKINLAQVFEIDTFIEKTHLHYKSLIAHQDYRGPPAA